MVEDKKIIFPNEGLHHNTIIGDLEQKLLSKKFTVKTQENYCFDLEDKTLYGETDLFAVHPNKKIIVVIEVKSIESEQNTEKAYYQLLKDWIYFKNIYPDYSIALMYAYGKPEDKSYEIKKCRKNRLKKINF